jgi:hypothetical protein
MRTAQVLQAGRKTLRLLELLAEKLQGPEEHQQYTGDLIMATQLKDIEFLRKVHETSMENYSRACRRATALALGGRDLTDHAHRKLRDYLELLRRCAERTRADLETAIEMQAMAASV